MVQLSIEKVSDRVPPQRNGKVDNRLSCRRGMKRTTGLLTKCWGGVGALHEAICKRAGGEEGNEMLWRKPNFE